MASAALRLLLCLPGAEALAEALAAGDPGGLDITVLHTAPGADLPPFHACIVDTASAPLLIGLPQAGAVLIVDAAASADRLADWLRRGAQDVLLPADLEAPSLPLRIRAAVERDAIAAEARRAMGIDLATGLPHQQQLLEHMSHLMALREREPAPMALLVLRIEGPASVQARLGREAASVLRRKVAVRLRAGVRASDVVATLGEDLFAVLLVSLLAAADADRVAAKLRRALAAPIGVAGNEMAVAVAMGVGHYPLDGEQPEPLLRRVMGLAASTGALGREGFAYHGEGGAPRAAND